jgi:hypothetical protein
VSITEQWRKQFRIIRLMADSQERVELEMCAAAEARQRLREISPVIANQIFGRTGDLS